MKKILYIVFLLLLTLSLSACNIDGTTDSTEPTKPQYDHHHCVCSNTAAGIGDHKICDDETGWFAVNTADALIDAIDQARMEQVFVYLTENLTLKTPVVIALDADICICLNGHNLVMDADNYGMLTVTDCAKNAGTWTSNADSTVRVCAQSVFNMYAITLTIGGTSAQTQVVTIAGEGNDDLRLSQGEAYFNMYGGEIYNPNQTSLPGANVHIGLHGIFNMYDGKIGEANVVLAGNGTCTWGGNIALCGSDAQMNMYDGVISDGKIATEVPGSSAGGNIGACYGMLRIYGGIIKNGYACGNGGNIAVSDGITQLHLENVIVSGGECEKNGGNIYCCGAAELKNTILSDGNCEVAGGNVYFAADDCIIDNCTITGGRSISEPGGGVTIDANADWVVTLKGDNVFSNNYGSDILMYCGEAGMGKLSVSGITGTDEILITAKMPDGRQVFTCDTHPDATSILRAVHGFEIVENGGLLEIYKE